LDFVLWVRVHLFWQKANKKVDFGVALRYIKSIGQQRKRA